jgi:hypothetical protein
VFSVANHIDYSNGQNSTTRVNPDGALLMSATDLYLFAQALMNGKLIKKNTLQLMIADTVETGRSDSKHYGLGLAIYNIDGKQWIGHGGYSMGYDADVKMNMEENAAIVTLSNNNNCNTPLLNNRVLALINGKTPSKVNTLLGTFLIKCIGEKGMEYVKNNIQEMLTQEGFRSIKNEWDLIRLADEMDMAKMKSESLLMFELNSYLFPDKPNVFKAYAEAMVRRDKKKEAIELFTKASKINPDDEYANRRLKELQ